MADRLSFSRLWADRREARVQVLALICIFTVLRLIEAVVMGLGTDESYTVAVARDLHLSYFDHPPVHYWLVHFLSPVLGYGRGSRVPFILLFAGSTWLMFRLGRRLFGERAGVWAAVALSLTGFFSVAAGDWVLPDGPLIFFLLAAANALADGWFADADAPRHPLRTWLWAGLWIGLAALSKYQAALFCVGLGLYLLSEKDRRRDLLTPGPYLAAILTLLVLTPVLVWNTQHHFASFAFQGARGVPNKLHPTGPLEALGGQAALLLPWLFVPAVIVAWRAVRSGPSNPRAWFCLMLAAPAVILFTLEPLIGPKSLPHWSMPGWLFMFPLIGVWAAQASEAGKRWPRRWVIISAAILIVVGGLALDEAAIGWLGPTFPKQFKKGDPTAEAIEWSGLKDGLARQGLLAPGQFVVAVKWNEAGKIDEALKGDPPVYVFSNDPREFAFRGDPAALVGHDALIIGRPDSIKGHMAEVSRYFQSTTVAAPVAIGRGGRDEIDLAVVRAHNLLRPYPRNGL